MKSSDSSVLEEATELLLFSLKEVRLTISSLFDVLLCAPFEPLLFSLKEVLLEMDSFSSFGDKIGDVKVLELKLDGVEGELFVWASFEFKGDVFAESSIERLVLIIFKSACGSGLLLLMVWAFVFWSDSELLWVLDCWICCCLLAWNAINFAWTPGLMPRFLIALEAEDDLDKSAWGWFDWDDMEAGGDAGQFRMPVG